MVRKKRKTALTGGKYDEKPPAVALNDVLHEDVAIFSYELNGKSFHLSSLDFLDTLKQCLDLYKQIQHIQKFRQQIRSCWKIKLQNATLSTFVNVFIPKCGRLVLQLYLLPGSKPLRHNLQSFLQFLILIDDEFKISNESKQTEISIVCRGQIFELVNELSVWTKGNYTTKTGEYFLSKIQALVEFPTVLRYLVNLEHDVDSHEGLFTILEFCSCLLEQNSKSVRSIHEKASEMCGDILKVVIVFFSGSDFFFNSNCAIYSNGLPLRVKRVFDTIAKVCLLMLRFEKLHSDLFTLPGLTLCNLLKVWCNLQHLAKFPQSSLMFNSRIQHWNSSCNFPSDKNCKLHVDQIFSDSSSSLSIDRFFCCLFPTSRLSIARGIICTTDDDFLNSLLPDGSNLFFNLLLNLIINFCFDSSLKTRIYSFQVLEVWLKTAIHIARTSSHCDYFTCDLLNKLLNIVLVNWSYPSKKMNFYMTPIFNNILELNDSINKLSPLISQKPLIDLIFKLPENNSSKFTALLCLLRKFGAKTLMKEIPNIFSSIIEAVANASVSSIVSTLFCQFLQTLVDEGESRESSREYWIHDVLNSILSCNDNLRVKSMTYIVPIVLKFDSVSISMLLSLLKEKMEVYKVENRIVINNGNFLSKLDVCYWGMLEIASIKKKNGLFQGDCNTVLEDDLEMCLLHSNGSIRMAAFEFLCSSSKTTVMPSEKDFALVVSFLKNTLKSITSSSRAKIITSLKKFLQRVRKSCSVNEKLVNEFISFQQDATSSSKKGGWKNSANDDQGRAVTLSVAKYNLINAVTFRKWIAKFVLSCLYPCATFSKLTVGLDLFMVLIQVFHLDDYIMCEEFVNTKTLDTLLNLLVSRWDKVRIASFSIIELYPLPLPGLDVTQTASNLLNLGLCLSRHPRQRESNAGAFFIHLLFKNSGALISKSSCTGSSDHFNEHAGPKHSLSLLFVQNIVSQLVDRVNGMSVISLIDGEPVHGLLLAVRYIIEDDLFDQLMKQKSAECKLMRLLIELFDLIKAILVLSVEVLGDANLGVLNDEHHDFGSRLKVDSRGHLIVDNLHITDGEDEQRAAVGCWLAVKEASCLLKSIIVTCISSRDHINNSNSLFMAEGIIEQAGSSLLSTLLCLKHRGAVAAVNSAFEGICTAFLNMVDCKILTRLPLNWAKSLLNKLESSDQQYILRRSAGVAFSFLSILRAEPGNSKAIILPLVVTELLRIAACEESYCSSSYSSSVHALNVLKLIFHDASLSDDVACFVVKALELAVSGFQSQSFAIRNSSMMVFAAVLQRAIGDKSIADGSSMEGVYAAHVFKRFNGIRDLLLNQIEVSSQNMKHPCTLPLLVFISRLRPTIDNDTGSGDLDAFKLLISRCGNNCNQLIRTMSARALSSILPICQSTVEFIVMLISELPHSLNDCFSFNKLHGSLLQLKHLVMAWETFLLAGEKHNNLDHTNFVKKIVQLLEVKVEFYLQQSCLLVKAEFVQILTIFLTISNHLKVSYLQYLSTSTEKFCEEYISKVNGASISNSSYLCGRLCCDQAVSAYYIRLQFWQICNNSCSNIKSLLLLVGSLNFNVRVTSVKELKFIITTTRMLTSISPNGLQLLFRGILNQFFVEDHPPTTGHLLHILVVFQQNFADRSISIDCFKECSEILGRLCSSLLNLCKIEIDCDLVALSIKLVGSIIGSEIIQSTVRGHKINGSLSTKFKDLLFDFSEQVKLLSTEDHPVIVRKAVSDSIRLSFVLTFEDKIFMNAKVDIWFVLLNLLQDDDLQVRLHSIHTALSSMNLHCGNFVDVVVLGLVLDFIFEQYGHLQHAKDRMWNLLLNLTDAQYLGNMNEHEKSTLKQADDIKIFEPEINNEYKESGLFCQLLLMKIVSKGICPDYTFVKTSAQRLIGMLDVVKGVNRYKSWVGGSTYHPQFFTILHNLIASICVISLFDQPADIEELIVTIEMKSNLLIEDAVHPYIHVGLSLLSCWKVRQNWNISRKESNIKPLFFLVPQLK